MGCSYGVELTRLGGLAHLGGISLAFAGIPPRRDENFLIHLIYQCNRNAQMLLFEYYSILIILFEYHISLNWESDIPSFQFFFLP